MIPVAAEDEALLGQPREGEGLTVARNLSTRYLAIAVEAALGLVILPFNITHLGKAAYGLWTLTASVTAYFSVLDLGYSGAAVKFAAQYRARRDVTALNETMSTTFCVFGACSIVAYLVAVVLAVFIDKLFRLSPDQVYVGRVVLLVASVNIAGGIAFSVFGAVINGFQRYDLNNVVGIVSSVVTMAVNFLVLSLGFGLIALVVSMTVVRVATLWVYRANAYRIFPGLHIRPSLFRRERLREISTFSAHMAIIDWANKLNYSMDAVVIGAFMDTGAVAVWAIGQRLAELTQRLANQLNEILFPAVVEHDTAERLDRLQQILIQGTKLSMATVVPLALGMILLAGPLVRAWVGHDFEGSVVVLQLLSFIVIVRVGTATASTLLKGAGQHRLVAWTNMLAALCNIALSVLLVKPLGLSGVAVGTLFPVCIALALIVFPAGCRRVQLPLWQGLMQAVWPATWPAAIMAFYVYMTRSMVPDSLIAVGVEYGIASLIYVITFVGFGLGSVERRFYLAKTVELLAYRLRPASEGA